MDFSEIISKRVVYALPGMEQSQVRPNITYKSVGGADLCLDAYYPPGFTFIGKLPAVLFIHGDGPAGLIKDAKDWGQYISWGQLAAASGLVGIPFSHRSTSGRLSGMDVVASDVHDLIEYVRAHADELNVAPDSLCIWACSAGVPYLQELMAAPPAYIRCMVAYYGMMDFRQFSDSIPSETAAEERATTIRLFKKFSLIDHLLDHPSAIQPLFVAQAGLDDPGANASIDRFYSEACSLGVKVELVRHLSGHHGFDILDDDDTSREIIGRTLNFMQTHLRC